MTHETHESFVAATRVTTLVTNAHDDASDIARGTTTRIAVGLLGFLIFLTFLAGIGFVVGTAFGQALNSGGTP